MEIVAVSIVRTSTGTLQRSDDEEYSVAGLTQITGADTYFYPQGNGVQEVAAAGGLIEQVIPYATFFTKGSYSAYAVDFAVTGNPAYVLGVDHDAKWTVKPSVFPEQSVLNWFVPEGTVPGSVGVWGYHHIDWANYDNSVQELQVAPRLSANLSSLTAAFDWSFTGSIYFGLLTEIWLTKDGSQTAGNSENALFEVGFLLHAGDWSFHNSGTLIGTGLTVGGVAYTARAHGTYITFAPANLADRLTGTIDWKAALDYLRDNGVTSGSEWVNGIAFGLEPNFKAGAGQHGGVLTVNDYEVAVAGSATGANADHLGTNLFANGNTMTGWDLTALTATGGQSDMDGGTTATRLRETAVNSEHNFIVSGAFVTVPSRQMDFQFFEDVKADGRDKITLYVASPSFASQVRDNFDLAAETMADGTTFGSEITRLGRQIIDLGNGWYRVISRFRKGSGITQVFVALHVRDAAGALSYLGDITKGIIVRPRHRLVPVAAMVLSGSPAAASTGTPYSFTPTVVGGQDPLTFTFVNGSLPTGWSINSITGQISGTTSTPGTVTGTVRATGGRGYVSDLPVSIVVTAVVAPSNTVAPAITAPHVQPQIAVQGQTYTCSTGTWSGSAATYTYQWRRAGGNISGATGSTYVAQAADDGQAIDCVVTATNAAGSVSQASSNTLTGLSGTMRLSEPFASQGAWSSSGGVAYTGGQISWSTTAFNGVIAPMTGTNGKQFRQIADYTAGANPGLRMGLNNGGSGGWGATVTTSQKIDQTITAIQAVTGFALQMTGATTTVGSLDNILVVERP